MYQVIMSTDGACSGNPGPGGYGVVLRMGEITKELAGYVETRTTNNRMELLAVLKGVEALKKPCNIVIRTDSQFVCNGIACAKERSTNGWRTKTGAKCANFDLWEKLTEVGRKNGHRFRYEYVKGHSGDEDNERANFLAQEQIRINKR